MLMLCHSNNHCQTNMPSMHPPLLEPQVEIIEGTEITILNHPLQRCLSEV
jgi:hypothetical protein